MRRFLARAAAFAAIPLALAAVLVSDRSDQDTAAHRVPDGMVVYCLAEGRQSDLVMAASSLGLVRHGSTPQQLTLPDGAMVGVLEWTTTAHGDFARACQALRAADPVAAVRAQPIGTGTRPTVSVLMSAAAGALLAFGLGEWRTIRDRRRAAADRLRVAGKQFRRSVRAYADERAAAVTARPDAISCFEHRDDLRSEISRLLVDNPGYAPAHRLLDMLGDPTMTAALTATRMSPVADHRTAADSLTAWALGIEIGVEELARTAERILGLHVRARNGAANP